MLPLTAGMSGHGDPHGGQIRAQVMHRAVQAGVAEDLGHRRQRAAAAQQGGGHAGPQPLGADAGQWAATCAPPDNGPHRLATAQRFAVPGDKQGTAAAGQGADAADAIEGGVY